MWSRKSPDELVGHQRHRAVPRPSVATVVLEAKGDATVIEGDQPAVRDGNAVSVAGEVGKHRLGPGEGRFGVDEPVLSFEWREVRSNVLQLTWPCSLDISKYITRDRDLAKLPAEKAMELDKKNGNG